MKTIAVLLTVFNRKDKTLQSLERLYNLLPLDGYQVDVYLTNDGCTDGTPEEVAEQFPQVKIIHTKGDLFWNRGMWTAWDTAAKAKDYDFYLWLNDDTFVYDNMLKVLIEAALETKEKAIIVGATESTDHSEITYGGRLKDGKIPTPNGRLVKVNHFNGNIVLIPQAVYQALGNLDPYFTHSKGDFDYGLRAKKVGVDIYQAGEVLGECDAHPTLDKWCNPDVPFAQRWKMLKRPNGMPPKETFHLEKRHVGLVTACLHYVTIYVRCLCPKLWNNRK
jgi:GT2 family glycosyltransferase